jgi:hypothetical protein
MFCSGHAAWLPAYRAALRLSGNTRLVNAARSLDQPTEMREKFHGKA